MASSCGLLTFFCVVTLTLVVVSLAFTNDEEARASDDVALSRSLRSAQGRRGGRRGNNDAVVDRGAGRRGNRRGNRRNNGGGRRGGRGRGRGGRGGRRRERPGVSRRQLRMIWRLSAASGQFSLDLYNRLKTQHQEMVFSSHSIHTALAMTAMGARRRTAKQMMNTLHLKRRGLRNKSHLIYKTLVTSLTNSGNVTLNVANAVYVKQGLPVEEAFRSELRENYQAQFEHFDMNAVGGPEAPINAWVANKTRNKITDLLSQGTIDDFTAMIILNAIYFHGAWKDPFNERATSEQAFHRDDGSTAQVDMMSRTAVYNYTRADDLQSHIVELPYQEGRFAMYVIVPMTRNNLNEVEEQLTMAKLQAHLQNMSAMQVSLHLPKFRTETKFSLKEVLKQMGMQAPFSSNAQFNGICSTQELKITDVVHQAVIEVSEKGTEAAAATAVIISLRSFPRPTVTVRADHPFIYAIRDKLTETWLFMGKYSAHGLP